MSSAIDKLHRILSLEKEQGFRNRAVIGGLERFLSYWQREASEESAQPESSLIVQRIRDSLDGYDHMSAEDRGAAVEPLLAELSAVPVEADAVEEDQGSVTAPEEPVTEPAQSSDSETPSAEKLLPRAPEPQADKPDLTSLDSPVTVLRGVSTVNQGRLATLGVRTVRDLIYHLPRRYDDYAVLKSINRLEVGEEVTIVGIIRDVESHRSKSGTPIVSIMVGDGTSDVRATWFHQPYLAKRLRCGAEIVISGKVDEYLGHLVFTSPEWEPLQRQLLHTGRLVPVYALTKETRARWLRSLIKRTLDRFAPAIVDPLPASIRESVSAMDLGTALQQIHFPDDQEHLDKARERLCFDEFFLLQLGVLGRRAFWQSQPSRALAVPEETVNAFEDALPFSLTGAQRRAVDDIIADLQRPYAMSRLLQGDVGSGKTIVAVVAMLAVAQNGLQSAFMAPTSILAEQHFESASRFLGDHADVRCALLLGSLPDAEKQAVQEQIRRGEVDIAIGTHALIQDAVGMERLGLVVVDEQHRFGVAQRAALREKGSGTVPHLLAMSATPIPRTLALTIYGDLDVSVLDEMPPGRQEILTVVRHTHSLERIYSFIDSQIDSGRQAYVIYPLVEESEAIDARSAVQEHERLQKAIWPHRRLGLLHGRLSAGEKESVMAAFKRGEYDVLVSTSVVEVGVDVPNATVMLIQGAERFGLSQLHQFRGRVGRSELKSYCILVSDDPSEKNLERLRAMEQTTDGFALAEKDLAMRGPGDFLGVRQHGLPELKVANLSDTHTLDVARREALKLFESDPELLAAEHEVLRFCVERFWASGS